MAISAAAIRNHCTRHRGWSTHLATRRYGLAQPNRMVNEISRTIRRPRHARDASTAQACIKERRAKAIDNRNAREGTAALPYTEILHPTGRQYSLQRRRQHAEIYINPASAALTSNNGKTAPKAREGVVALPYTEFFISDFGSMISLELRLTERTSLQAQTLRRAAGARYLGT